MIIKIFASVISITIAFTVFRSPFSCRYKARGSFSIIWNSHFIDWSHVRLKIAAMIWILAGASPREIFRRSDWRRIVRQDYSFVPASTVLRVMWSPFFTWRKIKGKILFDAFWWAVKTSTCPQGHNWNKRQCNEQQGPSNTLSPWRKWRLSISNWLVIDDRPDKDCHQSY